MKRHPCPDGLRDTYDRIAVDWAGITKEPQSIEAAHMTAGVDRTRPLCAYPATAHYSGTGSTDEAKNFQCR